jgi:glycine/D-amino acid oxidase-like deaminating enzyme/nitrite reductase/ring-hydroxylating ferredoxin subunit
MNARGQHTKSLWMSVEVDPDAPRLEGELSCETVVVGAGIAGLSIAYELANAGQSVIVVDRGAVAGGMTSRTTAHLAPICDDGISALINVRGDEVARQFQQSQEAAVARIEENVLSLGIDCNFRRLDAFLFPALGMSDKDAREQCEKEHDAARAVGATAARAKGGVPLKGFEKAPVLCYPNQATFHPLRYLRGIVAAIRDKGALIFANSPVTKIDEQQGRVRITTETGGSVEATQAVFATNSPISTVAELHSKMAPYRTYAMAFTLRQGALPDALYWDMADPYHYVRLNPGPGTVDYLIAGGADHKSGEKDDGAVRFEAIEAWIRALVPNLGKEVTRWSGQVLDTIDYCGFIGRNPGSTNIFVSTGDSGQGMTHGALAGMLIKDLIVSGSSPWEAVYDPSRKTVTGVLSYLRENTAAVMNLAEYVTPGELSSVDELAPGDGGIIRDGLRKVAVCRDLQGQLHVNSAECTHLGCLIHWNSTEQCWDCPCHGSQFAADGAVLNAPAISPLEKVELSAKRRRADAKSETSK